MPSWDCTFRMTIKQTVITLESNAMMSKQGTSPCDTSHTESNTAYACMNPDAILSLDPKENDIVHSAP